jgi:hypothetical protein
MFYYQGFFAALSGMKKKTSAIAKCPKKILGQSIENVA